MRDSADKTYNMQIPGFGGDEVRQSGVVARKANVPAYQSRLAAIREAKTKRVSSNK